MKSYPRDSSFPNSPKLIQDRLEECKDKVIELYHDLDKKGRDSYYKIWKTVSNMIEAKLSFYDISIVITPNQQIVYETVKFWAENGLYLNED